jgi:hypothetical protein
MGLIFILFPVGETDELNRHPTWNAKRLAVEGERNAVSIHCP